MAPGPGSKLHNSLVCAAVIAWVLFALHAYLPALDYKAVTNLLEDALDTLTRCGLLDTILVLCMSLTAALAGRRFLLLLRVQSTPGVEQLWLRTTVGFSLICLASFVAAALRILHPALVAAMIFVPPMVWFGEIRLLFTAEEPSLDPPSRSRRVLHGILIAFIAAVLFVAWLAALGPEVEFDAVAFHMAAVRAIAHTHALTALPDNPHTFLPRHIIVLFAAGMALHSETTVKLINYALGALAFLGTYAIAARWFSRTTGLVAAAALAASPLFVWELSTAHVDCGFALFVLLALYCTLVWMTEDRTGWQGLAIYASAFSLGVKYQSLFCYGALVLVVLLFQWRKNKTDLTLWKPAIRFASWSLLGMAPWAVVNWIQTGNPLFPFVNDIFKSPLWDRDMAESAKIQLIASGIPVHFDNWWAAGSNFWSIAVDKAHDFHGNIGILFVMLLPLLMFHRRLHPVVKMLMAFSAAYWICWLFTGQHARYYLAALPVLSVVAAHALVGWLEEIRAKTFAGLATWTGVLVGMAALLSSPLLGSYGASSGYGTPTLEQIPWKIFSGTETREQYLSRKLLDYPAVAFLNQVPGKKRVFFWWNVDPLAAYVDGDTLSVFSRFSERLSTDDPTVMEDALHRMRITHVVVGQLLQRNRLFSDPEREFVQKHFKRIYSKNSVVVYEVTPQPVSQDRVLYDLASRLETARIQMPARPLGDPISHYVERWDIEGDSRYSVVTFPPAILTYDVEVPQRAFLRFSIGRKFPPCQGEAAFSVWIQDAKIFEQRIGSENPLHPVGWFDNELSLAPFAGQHVKLSLKTEPSPTGSCGWLMWGEPAVVVKP